MPKKIKHVQDLPKWFDLKKYDEQNTLDATGWYEQLLIRQQIKEFSKSNIKDIVQNQFNILKENPIIKIEQDCYFANTFLSDELWELKNKKIKYSLGVHKLTIHELYLLENDIQKSKRDHARRYFDNRFSMNLIPALDYTEHSFETWMDDPIDVQKGTPDSLLHLTVDVSLPKKILIDQFTILIDGLKQRLSSVGVTLESKLRSDFEGWIKFGILPYLDLEIWADFENVTIPNRVIADAIFLPGDGGEEVVRKTTQKIADEILSENHLNKLLSIASQEITEQKSL